MNPKIIYPIPNSQNSFYRHMRDVTRIVFISAALICFIVNYFTKGKAWSIIVAWSLFSIWQLLFGFRLVEFSVYSNAIRATLYLVILLILIDKFLYSGWAQTVIPIVLFAYLLVMFILYFAIYTRRQRHLVSIMMLGAFNVIMIPYSIRSWPIENWVAFSFLVASFVLFIVLIIVNWKDIKYEIKARLIIKEDE